MAGNHEVGYGKPPQHTRFEKGRSGNPKGRPKGAKNLKTELEAELKERIPVREGDKRKTVSKLRAMIKGLMSKAVQGDVRAAGLVTGMMFRLLETGAGDSTVEVLADEDLEILEAYQLSVRQDLSGGGSAPAADLGATPESSEETPRRVP